jgi:hypothetical protein
MNRRRDVFMEQMEDIFDNYGYRNLYEQIKYPLIESGIWQQVDTEWMEHFFESFDFQDEEAITVEEFLYFWQLFTIVQKSNDDINSRRKFLPL